MGVSHYQVMLTVKGLVHIGNGQKHSKKDYFIGKDGRICILDPGKFTAQLTSDQLNSYCRYLEGNSSPGLEEWLKREKLYPAAETATSYRVNTELAKAPRGVRKDLEIDEFIKDPYGCPYVPGSSFKGMLRTALLAEIISNDTNSFMSDYPFDFRRHQKQKYDGRRLDERAFWQERPDPTDPQAANDFMRFVSVSDSDPLSTDDLVFAKKYDKFSKNDKALHKRRMGNQSVGKITDGNELNTYRECLKPGTIVAIQVDVDDRINEYLPFAFDEEHIVNTIQSFNERYEECFLEHFDVPDEAQEKSSANASFQDNRCRYVYESGPFEGERCRNAAVGNTGYCNLHKDKAQIVISENTTSDGAVCYLGGGVDFDSKTVLDALFADDQERLKETSHTLYEQFPTKIDQSIYPELWNQVKLSEFSPIRMEAKYDKNGKLLEAKVDHRHWKDKDLGVSPHTLKFGIVNGQRYLMGKCELNITSL